jgi:Cys-rich protein (TIGR01571 family)
MTCRKIEQDRRPSQPKNSKTSNDTTIIAISCFNFSHLITSNHSNTPQTVSKEMAPTNNPMYYSDDDTESRVAVPREGDDDDDVATIRVIAPATLAEGYTFDVMVDSQPYTVEVPRGGVKEGQEFEVLYEPHIYGVGGPKNYSSRRSQRKLDKEFAEEHSESRMIDLPDDGTMPVQSHSDDQEEGHHTNEEEDLEEGEEKTWYDETTGAPIGRWRTTLISCCDVLTQSTFWMGICCTPVLIAQLVTRLNLSWNGRAGASKEEISLSFNRIVLSMMITLAFWKIPIAGDLALLCFYLLIVVHVGSHVRHHMRQKYKIPSRFPTRYCGDRMEDSCCMFFCGCCSAIQMARHTHDDKEFPGHGCTSTGLGLDAPPVV